MIHPIAFIEHGDVLIIEPEDAIKLKEKPQQILWINNWVYTIMPVEVVKKEITRAANVDALQGNNNLAALCFHAIDSIEIPKAINIDPPVATTNGKLKDAVPFAIDYSKLEAKMQKDFDNIVADYPKVSPTGRFEFEPEIPLQLSPKQPFVSPNGPCKIIPKQAPKYIPNKVYLMCKLGALLVGSYARFVLNKADSYNDFDLIVPPDKWHAVSLLITKDAKINNHGGWKFKDDVGHTIDVWPCSIDQHLRQCKPGLGKQEFIVDYINSRVFTAYNIGIKHDKK